MPVPPPRGVSVQFRGQIPPLEDTISGLRIGLLLAIAIIFLLLAANFQSMRLALAIVLTIPAVLCGVLFMLRLTGTTLNIQSFMGAIMSIGIAVANSILLVSFAERRRQEGLPLLEAIAEGAAGRLRAVLMTASAMIFGMVPMAIGASEGGAQAAPLGRAVIGGLIVSTFATLTILPSIYAILQTRVSIKSPSLNPMDPLSDYYDAVILQRLRNSTQFRSQSMKSMKHYLDVIAVLAGSALQQSGLAQTIELVPVVAKSVSRTIDLPGEFQPFLSVALHARVTGFVENVLVDRGSVVKQGDLLVELSAPEMKAQIAEAESKLQASEADRDPGRSASWPPPKARSSACRKRRRRRAPLRATN